MSVLSMPASRNQTDPEVEQLERLSEDISAQFAVVEPEDVNLAIAEMLRLVANTTGIDRCRLIEFDETGAPGRVHVASGSSTTTISDPRDRPRSLVCTAAVSRTARGGLPAGRTAGGCGRGPREGAADPRLFSARAAGAGNRCGRLTKRKKKELRKK